MSVFRASEKEKTDLPSVGKRRWGVNFVESTYAL